MCGIIGYVGSRDAVPIVLQGLRRLEYRGYDSCGIAVENGSTMERRRAVGTVKDLEAVLDGLEGRGAALGHTRWATHGGVTEANAHPHADCTGKLALVHNGIIENFVELRAGLKGHTFTSQTDSEVIAHLVEAAYKGDVFQALRSVLPTLRGSFALVVAHADEPGVLAFARRSAPLLIGIAPDGHAVASDATALLDLTRDIVHIEDDEAGRITADDLLLVDANGRRVKRGVARVGWTAVQAEKGGFPHFMLKEIHEVPQAVRDTLLGRLGITPPLVRLPELPPAAKWAGLRRIRLLACGSSYHASLVGKYYIETLAGIPCEVTIGGEYAGSPAVEERETLAIAITQSGETADTLTALKEAKRRGLESLAIVNVEGSTAARLADHVLLMRAGPEIGVASTKTYAAQIAALLLVALHLGEATRRVDPRLLRTAASEFKQVPHALDTVLQMRPALQAVAAELRHASSAFFLGRGHHQATAREASLKLKEIAYIHAEGYSMGELKHGPFALLTRETPVIALLDPDTPLERQVGPLIEIEARAAPVHALLPGDGPPVPELKRAPIRLPRCHTLTAPLVHGLAVHILAYEVASLLGRPIDRPRNLAKSVTVE